MAKLPREEIIDLEHRIYSYAMNAGADPANEYWVETPRYTCAESYCRDCVAEPLATELCKWLGDDKADVFLAMSQGGEQDHGMRCYGCGRLLSYCLTDYGARDELAYFNRRRFPRKPLPADVAYEISAMLATIQFTKDDAEALTAVRVGRRAVARIAA